VLALVASGLGDKEIARRLGLSPFTVRNHLRRLYSQQGLHSRVEAALAWSASAVDQRRDSSESRSTSAMRARFRAIGCRWMRIVAAISLLAAATLLWASHLRSAPLAAKRQASSQQATHRDPVPTVSTVVAPAAATPAPRQLSLVNADRYSAQQTPLAWNDCLAAAAARLAAHLAQQGYLSSVGGLTDPECGFANTAVNMGYWQSVNDAQLNAIFVANPIQKENIRGPYSAMGAAWAKTPGGVAFLVEEFG
jgi:uncharacterized protein YkwD